MQCFQVRWIASWSKNVWSFHVLSPALWKKNCSKRLHATLIFDSIAQFKCAKWFSSLFLSMPTSTFILTLMYPKWEKHVQLGLASDRLQSPPASSLLSHTIWRTICECLAMQWGRLNCGYRIGPDTQTLEKKAHTSREIWEEERYILFIFYFCAVVHSRSDSKREEGSGSRRGACAEHRKAAWRIRIRHLVAFPCVQKMIKLWNLKFCSAV